MRVLCWVIILLGLRVFSDGDLREVLLDGRGSLLGSRWLVVLGVPLLLRAGALSDGAYREDLGESPVVQRRITARF